MKEHEDSKERHSQNMYALLKNFACKELNNSAIFNIQLSNVKNQLVHLSTICNHARYRYESIYQNDK